ncbi:hypothetical protein Ac2012v2_001108 [Leucoagaricus gongylophorus]
MLTSRVFFASFLAFFAVNASPLNPVKRQATTTALNTAQINAFTSFTHFASTAYCDPSNTINWSCGANCEANSDFVPVASGGDGSSVQFWYVGHSPSQNTIIVGHQGTDTTKIEALVTDSKFFLKKLDSSLFPGVSSSVEAHSGFADEQAKTAADILSAVQTAISQTKITTVTVVGHSLGGAIALIDSIYLLLHTTGVTIQTIVYGCPRVGNQAFADYVDLHLNLTHITNKKDPIPIVPGRLLGYVGPSGEDHISEDNTWFACAGQDNTNTDCSTGAVPNIFESDASDHSGPYNGITMGCDT